MKFFSWFAILTAFALVSSAQPQTTPPDDKPTASEHVSGPHGLEAWTLSWPNPDDPREQLAGTLVIARNGHVLRKIRSEAILWDWIFWDDGRQVAYETGPHHFGMICVLRDVRTGRQIATFDCYHDLPEHVPNWVRAPVGNVP